MSKSKRAIQHNEAGLAYYQAWEIDNAITEFQKAIQLEPDNPEFHLNLARAYARGGKFDQAMLSLGEFLRTETDEVIAERYERLFSSAMDEVETLMVDKMRQLKFPVQQIGKGIQMWLEYRITVGRKPLRIPKPALWAAAIAYAITKINFVQLTRAEIAAAFGVNERSLKEKFGELVSTLDLMPADYRYFTGKENPLDKLVEAAQLLEEMERRFKADE
ncbi:MAG: tetratricopeptide repeat protein [Chloroflexi bacterium]|nr:MAG: tetratricopeptide repeat protein [Chloroflexota bacterium]